MHRVTNQLQGWQNYMNCSLNCFCMHPILQIWLPATTGCLQTSKEWSRERDLAPMKKWYRKLRHILKPKTKKVKNKTYPITFQEKFFNIQNNFLDHHPIYTDGSKQGMKVSRAAILQNQELLKPLSNELSIYSEEITAINSAMYFIANHKSSKFIIYSDSKSVCQALQNKDTSTPFIAKLFNKMNTLSKNNSIILTWIPSHISIYGNERADKALKKVLLTNIYNTKILSTNLKTYH